MAMKSLINFCSQCVWEYLCMDSSICNLCSLYRLLHVNDVLYVAHVLVVRLDVQDGRDRLPQLQRELLHCGAQLHKRPQAPIMTRIPGVEV